MKMVLEENRAPVLLTNCPRELLEVILYSEETFEQIFFNGKLSDWLKGRQHNLRRNYRKHLKRKVPITEWLPEYNLNFAVSDLIAGLTVGLTVIPQGIAYAIVAGLPPQYGLYSAFMGCFVYCIFGSCKDITIGPTAIMALMTSVHAQYGPEYAVLLTLLSGIIILFCGLLQLGFLIDFISVPGNARF